MSQYSNVDVDNPEDSAQKPDGWHRLLQWHAKQELANYYLSIRCSRVQSGQLRD